MSLSKSNTPPTSKMINMLQVISKFIQEEGYPPSVREIGNLCKIKSTSNVHLYLDRLEKRGLIKRKPFTTRTIRITKRGEEVLNNDQ